MQVLMPAWKRWGYEEGIEKGLQQGLQQGLQYNLQNVVKKMHEEGLPTKVIEKVTGLSNEEINKIYKVEGKYSPEN